MEVSFMKDLLYAILALIAAGIAAYFFYNFQTAKSSNSLIMGIIFALLAIILGGLFMYGRVNTRDDIHITE